MFTGALLSLGGLFLYVLNVVLIRHYLTRSRPFLLELEARLPPPAKGQEHLWEKTAGTGVVPKWVSAFGSVNLIWSLLITSFGPTHELMVLPCRMALAEAEPCEARRAERLGRSEGQRHPARAAPAAPVAIPVSSCGPPVCAGTGRTRFRSR
jgi:hypothetical protein